MAFCPDDVDGYIQTLRSGECISERSLKRLCTAVSELLVEESNVQPVRSPVTVSLLIAATLLAPSLRTSPASAP